MRAMNLLSALNDVRDTYVLESALPPLGEASRKAVPAFRRKGKDGSLGRVFSDGWLVAAVCTLVAIGTLSGMVWLGQRPPTPPVSSDSATFPSSSEEHPVTEGIHTASLVYVSNGDGTCVLAGIGSCEDSWSSPKPLLREMSSPLWKTTASSGKRG